MIMADPFDYNLREYNMITKKEPFEKVYEKQFSNIYNFIYSQLLHKERTEDVASDVFIKAMSSYDRYDPAISSVRTWLTNIARNTLIDEYRKAGIRNHQSLDSEELTPADEPSYEDEYPIFKEAEALEVHQLLEKLSPRERELVAMLYFENMKNEEIGQVLGINAKAVCERHRRLLVKMRNIATEEGFFTD